MLQMFTRVPLHDFSGWLLLVFASLALLALQGRRAECHTIPISCWQPGSTKHQQRRS